MPSPAVRLRPASSEWVSVTEAAQYTPRGFGERVIRQALSDRSLVGYQRAPGCAWAIRVSDLDAWIENNTPDR